MSCCDYGCDQSPGCTARVTPDTPHYCVKSRQVCATPWTCSARCRLITVNSDGSNPHQPAPVTRASMLRWFAVLVVSTALAALCVVQAGQIFN